MKVNMRLILYPERVTGRFNPKYTRAQKWLDNEVLKDSDRYVPIRTGNLRDSGIHGTRLGSGNVIYNAPYAARHYYGHYNYSNEKHPEVCRQWFEKAKAVNKAKWINGVKMFIEG